MSLYLCHVVSVLPLYIYVGNSKKGCSMTRAATSPPSSGGVGKIRKSTKPPFSINFSTSGGGKYDGLQLLFYTIYFFLSHFFHVQTRKFCFFPFYFFPFSLFPPKILSTKYSVNECSWYALAPSHTILRTMHLGHHPTALSACLF